jgi:hypothetical protein
VARVVNEEEEEMANNTFNGPLCNFIYLYVFQLNVVSFNYIKR